MAFNPFLLVVLLCRVASAADVLAHFMVYASFLECRCGPSANLYLPLRWPTRTITRRPSGRPILLRHSRQALTALVRPVRHRPTCCWLSAPIARDAIGNTDSSSALNWAPPDCSLPRLDWYVSRIDDAYTVAAAHGFKLVHSFDMSYTPSGCSIGWNTTFMASMIAKTATSPAAYLWHGDVLVSTYGGEGYGDSLFAELKSLLASQKISISLSPALTSYSGAAQSTSADPKAIANGMLANYKSIDGYLNCMLFAFPLVKRQDQI